MRRPLVSTSLVLGLTLVAVPSCRVQVGNTAQPATGGDPVAKPPRKDAQAGGGGDKAKRTNPGQPAADVSVWGHFVMADPERTVKRIADQVAPPGLGSMVSVSQLKSMLTMQFPGGGGEVAKHLDLSKPFGCVMVNPKQHEDALACAAGYDGGVPQLVEDLGQEGYQSGGADFAMYELGGDTYYFKGWGDHIGVALDPSLLAGVESTMKSSVIQPGKADRDVYVEAKPNVIVVDAKEELEKAASEMEQAMSMAPPGDPGSEYAKASAKAAMDMYRSFGDLTSAEFVMRIGKQRTKMLYRGTASDGTPTAKQYKRDSKLAPVDVGMMEALPDDAWLVGGVSFDFANIMKDPWMGAYFRMLGGIQAPDGTNIGALMEEMMTAMGKTLAGPTAFAVYPMKGSVGAMGAAYAVKPKKDSMAVMRKFLGDYKVETMVPSYAKYVKTTYKKAAFTAGGVKVDTYTVAPTKKAMKELKSNPDDYAEMKKIFGEVQLVMAYAQKGDRQYLVITTSKAKKAMERMMKAASGKGNLGKFGDARKRVKKYADGTGLMMVDVKGMLAWARSLDIDGELANVPKIGVALDDLVWTSKINKKGKKEYEFGVSQAFIDQVRSQ